MEKSPGPADYKTASSNALVLRNSSTLTAPRMVPHNSHSRVCKKKHHELTPADKRRNQALADNLDPEVLRAMLQKFLDHLQFSQNTLEDLLAMYDKDESGSLSIQELEFAFAEMQIEMKHADVHALICFLDLVRHELALVYPLLHS
jgi:hypothetical protein